MTQFQVEGVSYADGTTSPHLGSVHDLPGGVVSAHRERLAAQGWDPETTTCGDPVVVWGHGPARLAAIRAADQDSAYAEGIPAALALYDAHDDAWTVSLSPLDVSPSDLDGDPAVVGWRCEDGGACSDCIRHGTASEVAP